MELLSVTVCFSPHPETHQDGNVQETSDGLSMRNQNSVPLPSRPDVHPSGKSGCDADGSVGSSAGSGSEVGALSDDTAAGTLDVSHCGVRFIAVDTCSSGNC